MTRSKKTNYIFSQTDTTQIQWKYCKTRLSIPKFYFFYERLTNTVLYRQFIWKLQII